MFVFHVFRRCVWNNENYSVCASDVEISECKVHQFCIFPVCAKRSILRFVASMIGTLISKTATNVNKNNLANARTTNAKRKQSCKCSEHECNKTTILQMLGPRMQQQKKSCKCHGRKNITIVQMLERWLFFHVARMQEDNCRQCL